MAESKVNLKSPLVKVKEESEEAGVKLSIQKTKIMESNPITSWQIAGGKVEAVTDFIFLSSKPTFPFSSLTLIQRLFSSSLLSAIRVVSSAYLVFDISPGNLDSSLWFILISLTFHMMYSAYKLNKQGDNIQP